MDQSNQTAAGGRTLEDVSLQQPHWHALFFVVGGVILLVIGVTVRFALDLSAADDRVFAVEAFVSGMLAELLFFRGWLRKRLILTHRLPVAFVYVWPLLCLYVFLMRPFE